MPRHREGPVRNKQTGFYFFDSYFGLGPDRERVWSSHYAKCPSRAQFLFEHEWEPLWAKYYGPKPNKSAQNLTLGQGIEKFVIFEHDVWQAKE